MLRTLKEKNRCTYFVKTKMRDEIAHFRNDNKHLIGKSIPEDQVETRMKQKIQNEMRVLDAVIQPESQYLIDSHSPVLLDFQSLQENILKELPRNGVLSSLKEYKAVRFRFITCRNNY